MGSTIGTFDRRSMVSMASSEGGLRLHAGNEEMRRMTRSNPTKLVLYDILLLNTHHHRDTENTEVAQRSLIRINFSGGNGSAFMSKVVEKSMAKEGRGVASTLHTESDPHLKTRLKVDRGGSAATFAVRLRPAPPYR